MTSSSSEVFEMAKLKYALVLFDHDGYSTIVQRKQLYGSLNINKASRCLLNFDGHPYNVEILDLADDEKVLEERDTEWSKTHRADAIEKERQQRDETRRRRKYGGFLDIWPNDEEVPPETSTAHSLEHQEVPRVSNKNKPGNDSRRKNNKRKRDQVVDETSVIQEETDSQDDSESTSATASSTIQGNGRTVNVLFEGGGDYSGERHPKRSPCYYEGLGEDERDIVLSQIDSFRNNKKNSGCQTDSVIVVSNVEDLAGLLDKERDGSKKWRVNVDRKLKVIDEGLALMSQKFDKLLGTLSLSRSNFSDLVDPDIAFPEEYLGCSTPKHCTEPLPTVLQSANQGCTAPVSSEGTSIWSFHANSTLMLPQTANSTVPQSAVSTVRQSANSTLLQSTKSTGRQSTNSTVCQSTSSTVHQSTSSNVPQSTSSTLPHSASSTVPNSSSSTVPQFASSTVPQSANSTVSQSNSSTVPKSTSSTVPLSTNSTVPQFTSSSVPQSNSSTLPPSNSSTVRQSASFTVPQSTRSTVPQSNSSTVPQPTSSTVPQSTSFTVPQSNSSTVPQSNSSTVPQSASSTVHQFTSSTVHQFTSSTVPQSASSTVPQSTGSPSPQFASSTVPQSNSSTVPQFTTSTVPQSTSSTVPQFTSSSVPQSANSIVPQSASSNVPQFTSSSVPQSTSCTVPQSDSSNVPQSTSFTVPQFTSSTVPQSASSTVPQFARSNVHQSTNSTVLQPASSYEHHSVLPQTPDSQQVVHDLVCTQDLSEPSLSVDSFIAQIGEVTIESSPPYDNALETIDFDALTTDHSYITNHATAGHDEQRNVDVTEEPHHGQNNGTVEGMSTHGKVFNKHNQMSLIGSSIHMMCPSNYTKMDIRDHSDCRDGSFEYRIRPDVIFKYASTNTSEGNFLWNLTKEIYRKDELIGRNYNGRKGRLGLSPRRKHALMHAFVDNYGQNKASFVRATNAINSGIRYLTLKSSAGAVLDL